MADNQFYLTKQGKHLLASVQSGEVLSFTKVEIGEGEPISADFMEGMTSLINPKTHFPVTSVNNNGDGTVSIVAVLDNKEVDTRFFIKEIGLFAQDPEKGEILYAVCSCGDASDLFSANTDKELQIILEIRVTIGNATNVNFIINNSLVWATRQELFDLAGVGRTDETVKKNADDITALKLKLMMAGVNNGLGGLDENSILISFSNLQENEEFWGYWDKEKARLVG